MQAIVATETAASGRPSFHQAIGQLLDIALSSPTSAQPANTDGQVWEGGGGGGGLELFLSSILYNFFFFFHTSCCFVGGGGWIVYLEYFLSLIFYYSIYNKTFFCTCFMFCFVLGGGGGGLGIFSVIIFFRFLFTHHIFLCLECVFLIIITDF